MMDKKDISLNAAFMPGEKGFQNYMFAPVRSDSAIIGHELGHAKDYMAHGGKFSKGMVNKEIVANSMAPFKSHNYNEIMGKGLKTYQLTSTGIKASGGIVGGGLLSLPLIYGGGGIGRGRRKVSNIAKNVLKKIFKR